MTKFSLEATDTVYMNGKAVYNLRRVGKTGIIDSVELDLTDVEIIEVAILAAMEYAWNKGYDSCANAFGNPNPYARTSAR